MAKILWQKIYLLTKTIFYTLLILYYYGQNFLYPQGLNTVSPSLAFKGATTAIDWYKNVFDTKEKMRMENPYKTIGHAEMSISDSIFFLSEENPQFNKIPKTAGGNSIQLHVYVPDVDAVLKKALNNTAKILRPAVDMFYGD